MTVVVTPFPPAPLRSAPSSYPVVAEAFMIAIEAGVPQMNAQNVENNALNATTVAKAAEALASAATASAGAAYKGPWAGMTGTLNFPASVYHAGERWQLLENLTQVQDHEPTLGSTKWARIREFPAGTRMLFVQTSAPTGWTKDTTHNNKALRIVSGAAGSGGTVPFTTAFASKAVSGTVGNTTLTTAQIPAHTHLINIYAGASGGSFSGGASLFATDRSGSTYGSPAPDGGTGGAHNHSFTGTAIDMAVQYVDTIIATRN